MRRDEPKKNDVDDVTVEASSGNVFADLGLDDPEGLQARAGLSQSISDIIAARKLTQEGAARLLGIGQTELTSLIRGKLHEFTVDRLLQFLNALGSDVEIVVRPSKLEHVA